MNPENPEMDSTQMEYLGKGVFKCPKCGDTNDVSKETYSILVSAIEFENARGEKKIEIQFVELDPKMKAKPEKKGQLSDVESFIQDSGDYHFRDDITEPGLYRCEVLWYWYQCGGEEPEWDMDFEVLSKKKVVITEKVIL